MRELFKFNQRTMDLKALKKYCDNYIDSLYSNYIAPLDDNTRIRTVIHHDEFNSAINFPFMKKKDLTSRLIFKEMDKVVQSRKTVHALSLYGDKRANISFIIAHPISGRGKRKGATINLPATRIKLKDVTKNNDYYKSKQSIKEIFNTDNYCLIRAIVIGIAYFEKYTDKSEMLKRPTNRKLWSKVLAAVKSCRIKDDRACGLQDLIALEGYFKEYQIMLIDKTYRLTNNPIYLNQSEKFNKYLYLLHTDDHYNVLDSMASFLNKSYYCDLCKKGFDHTEFHNCITICKACQRMNCSPDFKIKCQNCDLLIQNKSCYDLHDATKCKILKKCHECLYFLSRTRLHICGDDHKWCISCKISVDVLHKCYKRTEEEYKPKTFEGFLFFDFESYLNEDNEHVVNLAMAQKVCKK